MLKYFSVENFKQFANKIEIDFSDVRDYKFNEQCIKNGFIKDILVYGKNASGKSNLGLAIMDITNHLVDKENGIIKLLDPPFMDGKLNPGYIKSYLPGVRENGRTIYACKCVGNYS